MKKKVYSAPAMQVDETQVCHMLAESLAISDKTVDGSEALSKEDEGDWNIWGE